MQKASPNGLPVVYVGRPTRWGNPFIVGKDGTPEQCIARYRNLYKNGMLSEPYFLAEIRGKNLACFCGLEQPCHADVLLEIANA
jgi:hypothetical protein